MDQLLHCSKSYLMWELLFPSYCFNNFRLCLGDAFELEKWFCRKNKEESVGDSSLLVLGSLDDEELYSFLG